MAQIAWTSRTEPPGGWASVNPFLAPDVVHDYGAPQPAPVDESAGWHGAPGTQPEGAPTIGEGGIPSASLYEAPTGPRPKPGAIGTPGPVQGDYRGWFRQLVSGLPPTQQSLIGLKDTLSQHGVQLSPANAANQVTKIGIPDGQGGTQWVRVGFGADLNNPAWDWVPQGAAGPAPPAPQFSDPSTAQLQQLLMSQMGLLSSQQAAQQQANEQLKARMPAIQAATDRLVAYLNSRATQLQSGQPYSAAQQQILRTQALDPIEADRQIARQRALQNIGSRGFDPTSGIAQDLLNQVDAVFNRSRNSAQNDLAARMIAQEQANQEQAGHYLSLVPQVQEAGLSGNLGLLQALDAAVNQPGQQAVTYANRNYQLPAEAMMQAAQLLGLGGSSPDAAFQQAMGLYGIQNQRRQEGADYYRTLMAAYPYMIGRNPLGQR